MSTKREAENEGARSFTRALEMVADGRLATEASQALNEHLSKLAAIADDRCDTAKGELTLKLKLAVEPTGAVSIVYELKTKEPTPIRPKGHLWLTPGNNLTPHNPRQQALPLHEVKSDAGPARDIETNTKVREV